MARWRLKDKHYLNCVGESQAEYDYKETSASGKQNRKIFKVPRFLDPEDPSDCNYFPEGRGFPGHIYVAWINGTAKDRDYLFEGPPTQDMEPLDDEARAETAKWAPLWGKSFMNGNMEDNMSDRLLLSLSEDMSAMKATFQPSSPVASDEVAELKAQVKLLTDMLAPKLAERRV